MSSSEDGYDTDFNSKDNVSRLSSAKIRDICQLCLTSNPNPVTVSSRDTTGKGKPHSPSNRPKSNLKKKKRGKPTDFSRNTKIQGADDDAINTPEKLVETEYVHERSASRLLSDANVPRCSIPRISMKKKLRCGMSKNLQSCGLFHSVIEKQPRNLPESEAFHLGPKIDETLRSGKIRLPLVSENRTSDSSMTTIEALHTLSQSGQVSSREENEKWETESAPVRGKYGNKPVRERHKSRPVCRKYGSALMHGRRPVCEKSNIPRMSQKIRIAEMSKSTGCARCSLPQNESGSSLGSERRESAHVNRQLYDALDLCQTYSTLARRYPPRIALNARSCGSTTSELSEALKSNRTRSASTNRLDNTILMDSQYSRYLNRRQVRLLEELDFLIQLLNRRSRFEEIKPTQRKSEGSQTRVRSVGVQTETTSLNASNQNSDISIQVQPSPTTRPAFNVSVNRLHHMQPRNRLHCLGSVSSAREVPHSDSVSANNRTESCWPCGRAWWDVCILKNY